MINLQQYYLEESMIAAAERTRKIDLRWKHKVVELDQDDDHVTLTVETPDGAFAMEAQWLIACDAPTATCGGWSARALAANSFKTDF